MSDLRAMIREILAEELEQITKPNPQGTDELVTICSSADLNAFALRLLQRARDGQLRSRVEAGQHRFILAQGPHVSPRVHAHVPTAPAPASVPEPAFARGLVSERDIAGLAEGTRKITIGRSVQLTPLARDELARKGIGIERSSQ